MRKIFWYLQNVLFCLLNREVAEVRESVSERWYNLKNEAQLVKISNNSIQGHWFPVTEKCRPLI